MIGTPTAREPKYQGTAKMGQKELMKKWFKSLSEAHEAGRKVIWTFVSPGPFELFRSFGIVDFVFPEIQSLQIATKGQALKYLSVAEEDLGYSLDLCGYLKIDVGLIHEGLDSPMGKIPPPDLIVVPTQCSTYIKWAEIWRDLYDVPVMLIDIPVRVTDENSYWGGQTMKDDRTYVLRQLWELVAVLEELTGKKLDLDLVAEYERQWNSVNDFWPEISKLNQSVPAAYDAYGDGLYFMGALQATRGSDQALPYLKAVKQEMEERIELGLWARQDEQLRLGVHFAPCWSMLRPFFGMFEKWKAGFVFGTYMNMITHYRFDTTRPLETLAEDQVYHNHPDAVTKIVGWNRRLESAAHDYHLDGIVLQAFKSCRLTSTPMLVTKESLQQAGIPALLLESDVVDPRYFSAAQLKNRIDAFCEMLVHKKSLKT